MVKKKREHDFAVNAFRVVQEVTQETTENEQEPKTTEACARSKTERDEASKKAKS